MYNQWNIICAPRHAIEVSWILSTTLWYNVCRYFPRLWLPIFNFPYIGNFSYQCQLPWLHPYRFLQSSFIFAIIPHRWLQFLCCWVSQTCSSFLPDFINMYLVTLCEAICFTEYIGGHGTRVRWQYTTWLTFCLVIRFRLICQLSCIIKLELCVTVKLMLWHCTWDYW